MHIDEYIVVTYAQDAAAIDHVGSRGPFYSFSDALNYSRQKQVDEPYFQHHVVPISKTDHKFTEDHIVPF